MVVLIAGVQTFLSTPSARRATFCFRFCYFLFPISIHALREEGDRPDAGRNANGRNFYPRPPRGGRRTLHWKTWKIRYFYPRPPRGGRPSRVATDYIEESISIHALREEGDHRIRRWDSIRKTISIHALREEGDQLVFDAIQREFQFLSTPSARRAT